MGRHGDERERVLGNSRAVDGKLRKSLRRGENIKVWVLPVPNRTYRGLPVCMAKGIEWRLLNNANFTKPEFN
jgi:hypothetical protein